MLGRENDQRRERAGLIRSFFFLAFFGLGLTRAFTLSASYAYLLTFFEPQTLALVYIGAAATIPAACWLYLWFERRVGYMRLLSGTYVAAVALTALFWAGLRFSEWSWVIPAAAVYQEIEFVMSSLVVWGLAERTFNIREGKRYFGKIAAGEPLGAIAGGGVIWVLMLVLAPADLLLLSSASFVVCLALLRRIDGLKGAEIEAHAAAYEEESEIGEPADAVGVAGGTSTGRDRRHGTRGYLFLIYAIMFVSNVSYFYIDNIFYIGSAERFPVTEDLAAFVGFYQLVVGMFSLLCTAFVSVWAMMRFGLLATLLLLPGMLVVLGAGYWGSSMVDAAPLLIFIILTAFKAVDDGVRLGLFLPAYLTVYQPLPPVLRTRAQVVSEGYAEQMAAAVAGVSIYLLLTYGDFRPVSLTPIALAFVGLWIVLCLMIYPRYLAQLSRALAYRELGTARLDLNDAAARDLILSRLRGNSTNEILGALYLAANNPHDALAAPITALLSHSDRRVRAGAYYYFEVNPTAVAGAAIERRIGRETPDLKRAALVSLAACWKGGAVAHLSPFLEGSDLSSVSGALEGLLRHGSGAGESLARGRLESLKRNREGKLTVIQVIERIADPKLAYLLESLLDDPDVDARHQAIHAAGTLGTSVLLPQLLRGLDRPADRAIAAAAVQRFGDVGKAPLKALIRSDALGGFEKIPVLIAYSRFGTTQAERVLIDMINGADPTLRHHALRLLAADSKRTGRAPAADWTAVIDATVRQFVHISRARDRVGSDDNPFARALVRALDRLVEGAREQMFLIAAILNRDPRALDAWRRVVAGEGQRRAYAVEFLDNSLPGRFRVALPAMFETVRESKSRALLKDWTEPDAAGDTADGEVIDPDLATPWVRACARRWTESRLGEADHQTGSTGPPPGESGGETMTNLVEKVLMLRAVDLFQDIPDGYLIDIAATVESQRFEAGDVILREGDEGSSLYIVAAGRVRVSHGQTQLADMGEGEVFGEMAALGAEPRSATVTALGPVETFVLENRHLEEIFSVNPDLAKGIIRVLCRRLRDASLKISRANSA